MAKAISQMTAAGTLTGNELVEVSRLSATVTITRTDISAQASDNSINTAAGNFLAAGFAVGRRVRVTGFTGNVANNVMSAVLTAATATKLTFGGADGDVIVDDAAGESVTITAWETVRTTAADIVAVGGGAANAPVLRYAIELANTTDSDPGAGLIKFNNASPASATQIYIDDSTSDGVDQSTYFASLGQTGFMMIQSVADAGEWAIFRWTATVDGTGYWKFTVTPQSSLGALDDADAVLITFDSDANAGVGDVSAAANIDDNTLVRGDGGVKGVQKTGITVSDNDEIHGYRANVNLQTGTTYTIDVAGADTDSGRIVDHANAAAITVTLPNSAPVGFACTYCQAGAGQITFSPASGANLRNRQAHTKSAGQYAQMSLYVRSNAGGAAAEWVLGGDTAL